MINNMPALVAEPTPGPPRRHLALLRLLSALLLAVTSLTAALLPNAQAAAEEFILRSDQVLGPGQRLVSPDGRYVLVMQGDGNLVEYAPGNRAIWATGTNVRDSVVRMQGDGNLVIIAPGNRPVWSTGTNGNPGATLELQSDANLVVYAQGHTPRWASGTQPVATALGERIAQIARAEAANTSRNREWGNNCNFYSSAMGERDACQAWCADFARWVWRQAGASLAELHSGARSFKGYGGRTWRQANSAADARVGDAVVFTENGVISHVGLVVAVNSGAGTITTIEGNTRTGNVKLIGPFNPRQPRDNQRVHGFTTPVR